MFGLDWAMSLRRFRVVVDRDVRIPPPDGAVPVGDVFRPDTDQSVPVNVLGTLVSGGVLAATAATVPAAKIARQALVSLLREEPGLTPEQIRRGLEGNLCRCTGYTPIVRAASSLTGPGGLAAAGEPSGPGEPGERGGPA